MARDTIGTADCPFCKDPAEVRENIKAKLYLHCPSGCGLIQATGQRAQRFLRAAMRPLEPATEPAAEPAPAAPEEPAELDGLDNPTGQPHAKSGWLDTLLNKPIL